MNKIWLVLVLFLTTLAAAQHVDTKTIPPHELPHSQRAKTFLATATTHQTTLSWLASSGTSCSGTIGYWVYTGATSGGENYSTPLNSTAITGLTYVDLAVSPSQTKFYTLKAGCSTSTAGLSVPSAEVSGTTPGDSQPNPPTGVGVVAQ